MNGKYTPISKFMELDLGSYIVQTGDEMWTAMICPICERDLAMPTGFNSYICQHPSGLANSLEDFQ